MFSINEFMEAVKQDNSHKKTWEELVKSWLNWAVILGLFLIAGVIYANFIRQPSGNIYNYYSN